ncbi:MAG: adenylate/guanylate cyclase domain-containing protein [Rhodospirillaceae bacterium]|jgi:adenylate cyclase|nr:adenylate/guanylate cyclase domain-containing protein [Rhodospirillaceae bacterium]MBT4588316.1 adenylate/guanylate cyclase domain-containing protein [Rhodospirillaceae bacterium]MBT7954342.1 adenylate/guanylate cyclase domain-containing protein [Rhodospirillaceae bacterium]
MNVTARARNRVHLFIAVIAASAMIGASYAVLLDVVIRSEFTPSSLTRGAIRGTIIGLIMWSFEMFLSYGQMGARLRRSSFATSLILRTIASTAILMTAIIVSRAIVSSRGHSTEMYLAIGFLRDTGVALFIVFGIHFVLQVKQIIGGRVLANFILGRYHRPVEEERIFLFLDIAGSTKIAQRLGDKGAHSLVTRFFFDIADPILGFGGETHRYIGDEVVVTWPILGDGDNARCLECYVAICDKIAAVGPSYQKDFGIIPEFRVGLHGGPVVAGECGDDKRDIVYFGDTVNTAKRVEEACREFDRPMLISGDLLARINLPDNFKIECVGKAVLRGRENELELFSLEAQ